MRKLVAAITVAALLALPSTALAKYEMGGGGGSGTEVLDSAISNDELSADERIIADAWKSLIRAGLTDELSANERIIADAWKSHLHFRKAAAFVGLS